MLPLPLLLAAATLVAGALAARAIRRPGIRERHEVPGAVVLAALAGIVLGTIVELLFAALAGLDTGVRADQYVAALPIAILTGLLTFSAGLAGYWAAARVTAGQAAALGALAGPLVFLGLALLAIQLGR